MVSGYKPAHAKTLLLMCPYAGQFSNFLVWNNMPAMNQIAM